MIIIIKKLVSGICIVILMVTMFSGVALAAEENANLDIKEVVATRKAVQSGEWLVSIANNISLEGETYDKDEVVYVLDTKDQLVYGNGHGTGTIEYLQCYTEYGVRYIPLVVTEDYNYLPPPKPKVKASSGGTSATPQKSESSGGGSHSKKVRITAYCKACNGGGGTHTASGVKAYVGGCAMKGVPFGTVVHTSYGDFTVMDRPGGSNILDIYIGDYDSCHCSGAGYHGSEVVTWD